MQKQERKRPSVIKKSKIKLIEEMRKLRDPQRDVEGKNYWK